MKDNEKQMVICHFMGIMFGYHEKSDYMWIPGEVPGPIKFISDFNWLNQVWKKLYTDFLQHFMDTTKIYDEDEIDLAFMTYTKYHDAVDAHNIREAFEIVLYAINELKPYWQNSYGEPEKIIPPPEKQLK